MIANSRRTQTFALVVAATLVAPQAFAQTTDDATRAQSAFDEGLKLLEQGHYVAACPKLAESLSLDPAGGTALDLAFCYEHEGRLASALATYRTAKTIAEHDGRSERAESASHEIARLEAAVGTVRLLAPADTWRSQSWSVMLDARSLTPEETTAPIPVDAGSHAIEVTAPGKQPFTVSVFVADGAAKSVPLEPLRDLAVPAAPQPARRVSYLITDDVPRRSWGIGLGASGIVALGVGIGAAVAAANNHAESNRQCPPAGCVGDGVDAERRANTFAWVSNVAFAGGAILVGAGAYLFLSSKNATRTRILTDAMTGKLSFDLR